MEQYGDTQGKMTKDETPPVEQQRTDLGTFMQKGKEPLADKPRSVKLPRSIDAKFEEIPNKSDWLRKVICKAVNEYHEEKQTKD